MIAPSGRPRSRGAAAPSSQAFSARESVAATAEEQQQRKRERWARLRRKAPSGVVRLVIAAALLCLGVALGNDKVQPDRVWIYVGLLGLVVVVLFLTPSALEGITGRVGKLTIGSFSVEMAKEAAKSSTTDTGSGDPGDPGDDIFALRMSLQAKLAFLAKHVLVSDLDTDHTPPSQATFLTIGSLLNDKLLTEAEARTADTILTAGDTTRAATAGEFVKAAKPFVTGFRATVFHAYVVRLVRDSGARADLLQIGARRHDIVTDAFPGGARRLVPTFETNPNSDVVNTRKERIEVDNPENRVVIRTLAPSDPEIPGVWTLGDLRAALAAAQQQRSAATGRH